MSTGPAELSLRLLGEVEVLRDGAALVLPSSRKARALLVYLAATGRSHRRERLCSMFWDIPDDPRAALRSSLSMIRRVVDTPKRKRITAERDTIRFDAQGVDIDLGAARRLLLPGSAIIATEELERTAASFRGEFAEGAELPNCPDFQAWCVAEREEARRLRATILKMLIERHAAAPEKALPHARALAGVDGEETHAHIGLLRLLLATGRHREAEEQREVSANLLHSRGAAVQELTRAWAGLLAEHESGAPRPASETVSETVAAPVASDTIPVIRPTGGTAGRRPLVVLPFANISRNPEQEYLADGITEDLTTDLSQVSALFVTPRNIAFAYKGKPANLADIARSLNVGHVLQGSVQKAGEQIRINVQLIDALSADHLWAERFEGDFANIFALQDEISQSVVAALKLKLLPQELQAITTRSTSNAQAYKYYLRGRARLSVSWGTREYLSAARRLFAKAVKTDPGYARAYAGIADCDAFLWVNGDLDVAYEQMIANSSRALELAPNLAEAHSSRGLAFYVSGHPREAMAAFDRAMALDSGLFEAHYFYGFCSREIGDPYNSVLHFERAAEIQPKNYQPLTLLSEMYLVIGDPDRSIAAAKGCIARIVEAFGPEPEIAEVLAMGAATLVYLDDYERAERWADRAVHIDSESYTVRYNVACSLAVIGRLDKALEFLEIAFARTPRARGWLLGNARQDSQLNSLRQRADFQDLMKRLEANAAAEG
jgi:TolB-like protein/DNA-binding SARP family transcriptional activator/Tfp pilus assembly protein PilF